jgi:hypothetical protein
MGVLGDAILIVLYLSCTDVNSEWVAKSFRVGGRGVERIIDRLTVINIDEGTIQLARALPYIPFPSPSSIHRSISVKVS